MGDMERIEEAREYAYLHGGILADEDVRGLSDAAFRLWVCALVKAVSAGSGTISVTVPKRVAAWSGLDISQIEPAVDELISARFLLVPTDGAENNNGDGSNTGSEKTKHGRARHLTIRNFSKYQAAPLGEEPVQPEAPQGAPVDAKELKLKLRARLDEAEEEMGMAPYQEIIDVVIPQALEDYRGLPGLGNGACLLDTVVYHAGAFFLGGVPEQNATKRIWYNQLRKMRSDHGATATVKALEVTAAAGISDLRYVWAVLRGEGRR